MSTSTVKVTPASPGTIQFLKNTFSSSGTFIGELMANSRRAGATEIRFTCDIAVEPLTLHVQDNGDGITDLAALLTIFESGWGEETKNKEDPFGMGFYASLFACNRIHVKSVFGTLISTSEYLYQRQEITYDDDNCLPKGAEITLTGIHGLKAEEMEKSICAFAKGFPTPVFYNGVKVDNSHAITNDAIEWAVDEESGVVMEGGYRIPREKVAYYQGLPIESSWSGVKYMLRAPIIVHLDGVKGLKPRMPDRQAFLDSDNARKVVNIACDESLRKRLSTLIESDPKEASAHFAEIGRLRLMPELLKHGFVHKTAILSAKAQVTDIDNVEGYAWGKDCILGQDTILPTLGECCNKVSLISSLFDIPYLHDAYSGWGDSDDWASLDVSLHLGKRVSRFIVDGYSIVVADIQITYDGETKELDTPVGYEQVYYIPINCLQGLMYMTHAHIDVAYYFDCDDTCEGGYVEQLMRQIHQKAIESQVSDTFELLRMAITDLDTRAYGADYKVSISKSGEITVKVDCCE